MPLLLLLLPACSAADGKWPSLARRPGELSTTQTAPAASASAPVAGPASEAAVAADAAPAGPAVVAAARLSEIQRDVAEADARWRRQNEATQRAVAAARGTAQSSEAWAGAQLELSRLEKAGAALRELRERLDSVSGELAVASAAGANVAEPLGTAGRLIERVESLRAEQGQAFEAAQRQLQR
jgi:hypothetical protein